MDSNFRVLFKIFTNKYAQWTVLGAGHLSVRHAVFQSISNQHDFINDLNDQMWTTVSFDLPKRLPPISFFHECFGENFRKLPNTYFPLEIAF